MTTSTMPKLPHGLMAGGSSVAVIARDITVGVLAHKSSSQSREVEAGWNRGRTETYYITACAADQPDDADDAYLVSAAWADHLGAVACTESACFPAAR